MTQTTPSRGLTTSKPGIGPSPAAAVTRHFPTPVFEGDAQPSIIPDAVRQVVFVTGFRGQGKTIFCLGADNPANVLMLDYESKGEGLATPLGIGGYFSVLDDCADVYGLAFQPIHIFNRTKQILETMPEGRFTTLILDNAALLQDGCLPLVEANPTAYGVKPANAQKGTFGGAWPGVKYILRTLFAMARTKGIKVIFVTFQLSKAWGDAGPLLNKFKTTDVSIWHEMSVLTVVLSDPLPQYIPAPSGLVMKEQLASATWDPNRGEVMVQRRVPYKLPKATMSEVYKFLREPFDFSMPIAEQIEKGFFPKEGEIDPYLPTFKKEQLKALEDYAKLAATLNKNEEEEE